MNWMDENETNNNSPEQVTENSSEGCALRILSAAQQFIVETEALEEVLLVAKPVLAAKRQEHVAELGQLLSSIKGASKTAFRLDYGQLHRLLGLAAKMQRGSFLFRGHLLV